MIANSKMTGDAAGERIEEGEGHIAAETGGEHEEEAHQLALDHEDERLPWLDSDDADAEATSGGSRILGLALMGLVALAAIVGGIWWGTHRMPDRALLADGSTIAAPSQPYKEAPKNPGGKTFEGTGDTAFAVSEGKTSPAKLGERSAPKPGVDMAAKPAAAGAAQAGAPGAAANDAGASGPAVQVGAYSTRELADAAWTRLSEKYSELSGQHHRVVEGQADIGTVYRLQALPGDADAAQELCGKLKSAGLACQVKE